MTDKTLSLRIILGSARANRFADIVAAWVTERLASMPHIAVEVLDPRELKLPLGHDPEAASVKALRESLDRADAFIIVTPEYNRSYTGELKTLIDSAYAEWNAKPVGFISYGGISGGLSAVEHLRTVFAETHAATMRDVVSFSNPWTMVDAGGKLAAGKDSETAFQTMMGRLEWWANALKLGRAAVPYRKSA
ncbi:NADPH-dependent FMN reductase [Agrobacterium larrymoorei]|uniref:NAD(P)H-dependent FMN reductase n=1 Tax=Agrobacterium larrymoorei TaxID=160699 RepID=A0ABU0UE94_9HYPH|nr:NAD(P)H-dependent oxidoreductase [Agrobacterium larrymoorei]MDQ1183265.1 NAD(P)H-dependent FMN reductase [Agrobacterium larrymoorei]